MTDDIMLAIGEDGKASLYDDTYDITIHCESKEEQDEVKRVLQNVPHWIPVTERLPEEEGEYLVTSVYQYYRDGRKTYKTTVDRWSRNGAGKEWVATSNDAHIAWMPLPEPYKGVTT